MKSKLLILLFSSLLILSFNSTTLANSNNKLIAKPSSITNFEKKQLSDDALNEKALSGDLVNNQHTTVTVTEIPGEDTKTIEINKVLSEEILEDGEVVTENSKTVTTFTNPSPDTDTDIGIAGSGSGSETFHPGSYAVNVKVSIYYNTMSRKGITLYKLGSFLITPKITDSSFSLTKMTYEARSIGAGYLANGQSYSNTETTGLTTISNVVNNGTYSRSLSFIKYIDKVSGASSGVTGTLSYKRNNSTVINKLPFSLGI